MTSPSVSRLRDRVAAMGVPQSYIAALCGISQAKLSRAFAGYENMSGEQIEKLDLILRNLDTLIRVIPFPLDLKQIDRIQELLAQLERGELGRVVVFPTTKSSSDLLGQAVGLNAAHAI